MLPVDHIDLNRPGVIADHYARDLELTEKALYNAGFVIRG
jgi:hypothetical protein